MTPAPIKPRASRKPRPTDGIFRPGELYTLAELRRRTGMGSAAIRVARKQGLRVVRQGNTRYVWSDDFLAFVRSSALEEVQ